MIAISLTVLSEQKGYVVTHFLGPNEKGCTIARLSLAYSSGGLASQRSGTNCVGLAKLSLERLAINWLTEIDVWCMCQ